MTPARGEVWFTELLDAEGHEQAGIRPAVIFQTDYLKHLGTVVVIPMTTQMKRSGFASTVVVPQGEGGLPQPSVALCHQIRVDRWSPARTPTGSATSGATQRDRNRGAVRSGDWLIFSTVAP